MKYNLSSTIDQQRAILRLETLIKRGAKIELKEFQPIRSMPQHRYAHKCIEIFFVKELGYTMDEGKIVAKQLFAQDNDWSTYTIGEHTFFKSFGMSGDVDKLFNKEETMVFIEWIRNLANEHGTYIASAEDYLVHQWEIDGQ